MSSAYTKEETEYFKRIVETLERYQKINLDDELEAFIADVCRFREATRAALKQELKQSLEAKATFNGSFDKVVYMEDIDAVFQDKGDNRV